MIIIIIAVVVIVWLVARGGLSGAGKDIKETKIRVEKIKPLLVDEKEQVEAVLGSGYLDEFVINRKLKSAYGIVTDKRLYIQGTCYQVNGKKLRSSRINTVVDLEDITSSGLTVFTNISAKIAKYILMAAAVVVPWGLAAVEGDMVLAIVSFTVGCLAAMWIGLLWKTTFRIVEIRHAGGEIAFPGNLYSEREVGIFQTKLRASKERVKNARRQAPYMPVNSPASGGGSVEDIVKAAELLKSGLLSEDEYRKIKDKALK